MSRGLEVLKTLIQYGVPLDVKDKDGREPMLWAASSGNMSGVSHREHVDNIGKTLCGGIKIYYM
jgi:ankyrin repeat protein